MTRLMGDVVRGRKGSSPLIPAVRAMRFGGEGEPEGGASRGRLIPFGRFPGVPIDTR